MARTARTPGSLGSTLIVWSFTRNCCLGVDPSAGLARGAGPRRAQGDGSGGEGEHAQHGPGVHGDSGEGDGKGRGDEHAGPAASASQLAWFPAYGCRANVKITRFKTPSNCRLPLTSRWLPDSVMCTCMSLTTGGFAGAWIIAQAVCLI
jgi:hypothetical protein